MSVKPIKRHEALKAFSKDHHHGLLLCWKIREGLKRNIDLARIKAYANWFWENHLQQHFNEEEKYIFCILPADDALIIQALEQHKRLQNLFEETQHAPESLQSIQKELDEHIRYEERILFNKIQEVATEEQLNRILEVHKDTFCDNWQDEFWTATPPTN